MPPRCRTAINVPVQKGTRAKRARFSRSPSEELECDGLALHPKPQVRHEDEIGMCAAGEERVAVTADDRGRVLGVKGKLAHRRHAVFQEPRSEAVVRFEGEETPVETVGGCRRESIMELSRHTGHSATALP